MSREKAAALLVNYFQAIARHAGMKWDPDYTAEIEQAVDEIVAAAVAEWRSKADGPIPTDRAIGIEACANDLTDALASLPEPQGEQVIEIDEEGRVHGPMPKGPIRDNS